jgi:hypothetical protein
MGASSATSGSATNARRPVGSVNNARRPVLSVRPPHHLPSDHHPPASVARGLPCGARATGLATVS